MGSPKAWLTLGDDALLQRVVRIVSGVVRPVVVAGRANQSLPPLSKDVRLVHDRVVSGGPLAGVDAGFDALAARCDAALVVSCDLPLIRPTFIRRLIELLDDHPAVVPERDGRLHPLAAVYRLTTHAVLTEQLADRDLRAHQFARRCGAHVVAAGDFQESDPTLESLVNINDRQAYERVRRALEA